MASEAWTSTKALSVYNVLLKANQPIRTSQVAPWLQKNFRGDIDDDYVSLGVGYLVAKGFVAEGAGGTISMTQPGKKLKRVNGDIDLDWA